MNQSDSRLSEDNIEQYLSIKEFAVKVKFHPNTIRRAIKSGRINAFKIGSGRRAYYRIPQSEIHRIAKIDLTALIEEIIEKRSKGEKTGI